MKSDLLNLDSMYGIYLDEQLRVYMGVAKRNDKNLKKLKVLLEKMFQNYLNTMMNSKTNVSIQLAQSVRKYKPILIEKVDVIISENDYMKIDLRPGKGLIAVGDMDEKDVDTVTEYISVFQKHLDQEYSKFSSEKEKSGEFYIDSMLAHQIMSYYDDFLYGETFTVESEERWNHIFGAIIEDYISEILQAYGYKNVTTHVQVLMPLYWAERDSDEFGVSPSIDFIEFVYQDKKYRYVVWGDNRLQTMFKDVFPIVYELIVKFVSMVTNYMKEGKF